MHTIFRKSAFALANTVAVLSALYIALAFDLERPYWAMFTVFIVAKPMSGAVRSKAVYRLAGTLAGAAMAVFLVPPLVQAPVLLCLAMSAWVGTCLYFSLLDRTPRSYAFMLAGYTATIVGFSVVGSPDTVFDTAVSRVEEISLGLVCASIAHSIFFPQNIAGEINEKLGRTIQACANWIGNALTRPLGPEDEVAHRRLAEVVTDLHLLYTHVWFETSDVPRASGVMRALQDRLTLLSAYLTTLQKSVQALAAHAPLRAPIMAALESVSNWARALADGREGGADPLGAPPGALAVALDESQASLREWESLLERAIVVHLGKLVRALKESSLLAAALRSPGATLPSNLQREATMTGRRTLHLDRGLAAFSGCAAAVSCLIACVLWIQGSWPEGTVAAQFAAIGCCLFATLDRPAKVLGSAIVGVLLALPFGAVYEFAIFPRIDGFPSLALVLAPVVLLFSLMQTSEKLEGAAMVLAIAFSGSLALQSTYQADFAAFVNTNSAEVMGLLVADVTVLVFRTIDPVWSAVRISRAGWRSMSRLAGATDPDIGAWSIPMFDRLGLVASRLGPADPSRIADTRVDPLRDLRVGLNVAAIKQAGDGGGPGVPPPLRRVLNEVAGAYEALARGRPAPAPGDIQASIDAGIASLAERHRSASMRDALAALTALRLDLAPSAAPYRSLLPAS
ncbi:MAG: FUSC family protein [Steroidobacteraceae bacterium]